jgi:hypothetical protein
MTTTKHLTDEEALAAFESGEGFEPAPGEYTPLGRILLAREARDRADALLTDAVRAGREAGLTWEQVGAGLGITKEGARKHYNHLHSAPVEDAYSGHGRGHVRRRPQEVGAQGEAPEACGQARP